MKTLQATSKSQIATKYKTWADEETQSRRGVMSTLKRFTTPYLGVRCSLRWLVLSVLSLLTIAPSVVCASVTPPAISLASHPPADSLRFAQFITQNYGHASVPEELTAAFDRSQQLSTHGREIEGAIQLSCSRTNPGAREDGSMMPSGPSRPLGDRARAGFPSELAAVITAMNECNPSSIAEDREYMGAILKDDDQYSYTVTPGECGVDKVSIRLPKAMLPRVTALWHTHGSPARERKYFSDVDTQLANSLRKRFYLGDHTGNLRVFEPGGVVYSVYKAGRMGLPSRRGFASGKLVRDGDGQAAEIAT